MAQSYDPSKYHHVTWRAPDTAAGPVPRGKQDAAGINGPWFVGGYLFCFADPEQWAYPGANFFTIDLTGLEIGTPWTVSADVTELIPPSTPHIGDASFMSNGVTLNQPARLAYVIFYTDSGSPLPVAIMMNIGCTAHPLLPGKTELLRAGRGCAELAVIDVLQCVLAGILGNMSHPHPHATSHGPHDHGHEGHEHATGLAGAVSRAAHALRPHSHEPAARVDPALEASTEGMRVLWVSLAILAGTAAVQAAVAALSGSVALLGDTLHNAADALTAVPLAVAFIVGRRPPDRRYTYGYGRAEDLAGVVIVVLIAASCALAASVAVARLLHPQHVSHLPAVAAAALAGFAGNELAARYRIRAGRRIGSAALLADGLHARADGLASLGVLAGAGGVALGWNWADPVVGLVITVVLLSVLWRAAREIYRRLMDAVDPELVDQAERALRGTQGVLGTGRVRLRWIGHRLHAEAEITVSGEVTAIEAHQVAVSAEHHLLHALPRLSAALVHADPAPRQGVDDHAVLASHRPVSPR